MFAGVVRVKFARRELKHETELLLNCCWRIWVSLLPGDEVAESFTEDMMFDMPDDARFSLYSICAFMTLHLRSLRGFICIFMCNYSATIYAIFALP